MKSQSDCVKSINKALNSLALHHALALSQSLAVTKLHVHLSINSLTCMFGFVAIIHTS